MDIPDYESLMPRVLRLATVPTSGADAVQRISDELELTEEQRRIKIPSGTKPLIKSRIDWAVTYLVHAGLMERPRRGSFVITDRGRECLERDGPRIDKKYLYQFAEFREFLARRRESATSDDAASDSEPTTTTAERVPILKELELGPIATPDEQLGQAYELIESEVRAQLLDRILAQSPEFFENLVVTLLSTMGYGSSDALAKAVGRVGDGGIDGIIHQDKLGLDVVYIQAKRYGPDLSVGRPELQSFIGALLGVAAHKGVFVTTSRFTRGALEYVRSVPQRIVLVDGERLVELMIKHGVGVKTVRTLEIHRLDEDFFIDAD